MGEIVRVSSLTRDFRVGSGVLRALDNVSFTVEEGETLGIVGESGCGKSTLARILVGIERPTAGDVRLGGLPVAGASRAERLRLARFCQMIFQDPYASLNPRLKVGTIVGEPFAIHTSLSRAERKRQVARLLERVGLPADAAARFPHAFSGGQRQRIGIARALALKPRVLVADEPVSALDVSVQAQVLNLLGDLKAELGLTLLLVSHSLDVVRWASDRVLVMYLGRVVELGSREAVLGRPQHPYTQALLDAAPRIRRDRPPLPALGEPPSPLSPPSGCPFHPRCPLRQPECEVTRPLLEDVAPGHAVACHEARGSQLVGDGRKPE